MKREGFTLIELLIVVAIIGLVAAIAIPNMLTAIQKTKQKATMGDLKSIGTAVESYMTDHYVAPSSLDNAGFGNHRIFHIRHFPNTDAWGNLWLYQRDITFRDIYSICSPGKGGVFSGFLQEGVYITNSLEDFGNDIIYSIGIFVYGPKVQ